MDLVKGVPITRYCDEHHLTPRQRLELFIPVCQAVQHAHQKGIIHRDLKPSNVLVALYDGKPVPKVIDFGVAKAAGQQLTDKTLFTGFGSIVGTLEYMSPEQAEVNQLDIDTRSDIYSLGVLLYELLTGSPPFSRKELEKAGMLEMLRVIREQEPSKPSTKLSTADGLPTLAANRGTEPAKLTKLVRGELDWIVMKALEKDRSRRYETANGFAMDVQRYLADEPVQACPPSAGYRLRKFARRNKGGLAVAALVLFFLVLLGSGVGWVVRDRSAREAEAVRQQGERQAKLAGQVEAIFADVDRLEKEQKWPEALEAARRAEAAVAGGEADPATAERVRQRLKDLEFIDRLERIRMEKATLVDGKFDNAATRPELRPGLPRVRRGRRRVAGRDVDRPTQGPPGTRRRLGGGAGRLGFRPAPGGSEADVARWKRLVAVARGIDPEPLRDRLRATWGQPVAKVRGRPAPAGRVDRRSGATPATLLILARTLQRVQHTDSAPPDSAGRPARPPGGFLAQFRAGQCARRAKRLRRRDSVLHRGRSQPAEFGRCPQQPRQRPVRPEEAGRGHRRLPQGHRTRSEIRLRATTTSATPCATRRSWTRPSPPAARPSNSIRNSPTPTTTSATPCGAQKKLDEAIAAYRKAIELDPKYALAHNEPRPRPARSREAGRGHRLPTAGPSNSIRNTPPPTATSADALRDQNKLDEAIAAYNKAIELDPNFAIAHYDLGMALKAKGDLDRAIAAFEEVIRRQPDFTVAHFGLASALAGAKQWDRSASVYAAALKRFGVQQWPGPGYEAVRSDEVFTRLTAQQGDDRLPRIMRARLHVLERDWKRAAAEYGRVYESLASIDPAKLLPEGGDDLFCYGCLLLLLGDRPGYEQFLQNVGGSGRRHAGLGVRPGARLGGQPPPGCPCAADRRAGWEDRAGEPDSLGPPRPEPRPLPERGIQTGDRARRGVERGKLG